MLYSRPRSHSQTAGWYPPSPSGQRHLLVSTRVPWAAFSSISGRAPASVPWTPRDGGWFLSQTYCVFSLLSFIGCRGHVPSSAAMASTGFPRSPSGHRTPRCTPPPAEQLLDFCSRRPQPPLDIEGLQQLIQLFHPLLRGGQLLFSCLVPPRPFGFLLFAFSSFLGAESALLPLPIGLIAV